MSKYNEVMEHLTVTPEMRERILRNIEKECAEQPVRRGLLFKYVVMAACFALVMIGAVGIPKLLYIKNADDVQPATTELVQDIFTMEEKKNVQELSDAVGFSVQELVNIPYMVENTEYLAYGKDLAEINYVGKNQTVCYRMGKGTEDVSGVYETYADQQVITIGSRAITVNGDQDIIYLATWTDGTYAYSVYTEQGITLEQLKGMLTDGE